MTDHKIVISGFGGQGILFAGQLLANAAMATDRHVTWIPSYGAEMRGGTCMCAVSVSDGEIGSPLVPHPNVLIVMNLPSLDKYETDAAPGSVIFIDNSLVHRAPARSDVEYVMIPATKIAQDKGIAKLANVIMLGGVIKKTGMFSFDTLKACLSNTKRPEMAEQNLTALTLGYEYEG